MMEILRIIFLMATEHMNGLMEELMRGVGRLDK